MSHDEKINIIKSIKGKTNKQAQVILAEINPIAALPTNKEKPLSKSHTQLQIVVDEETMALLKQVQELLSHTIPDGDYNAVLKFMGKEVTEILRKKKGRSTSLSTHSFRLKSSNTDTDASKRCMHNRYIDKETKRTVYARANGQCEFVGLDGHRCESRYRLEIDHLKPWSKGGGNDEKNLRILCRTHNLYRTIYTHGFWYNNHTQAGKGQYES